MIVSCRKTAHCCAPLKGVLAQPSTTRTRLLESLLNGAITI